MTVKLPPPAGRRALSVDTVPKLQTVVSSGESLSLVRRSESVAPGVLPSSTHIWGGLMTVFIGVFIVFLSWWDPGMNFPLKCFHHGDDSADGITISYSYEALLFAPYLNPLDMLETGDTADAY